MSHKDSNVYYLKIVDSSLIFTTGLNTTIKNIELLKQVEQDILKIFDRKYKMSVVKKLSTPIYKAYFVDGHNYIVDFSRI